MEVAMNYRPYFGHFLYPFLSFSFGHFCVSVMLLILCGLTWDNLVVFPKSRADKIDGSYDFKTLTNPYLTLTVTSI